MEKDYRRMFELLDKYVSKNIKDADNTILNAIKERKAGKVFNFREHLQGMILAMLSGQSEWEKIYEHKNDVDNLFFHYDKDKIKNCNPQYFTDKIKQYNIGTTSTNAQMQALEHNISTLEKIEKEYKSLDNFITSDIPINIVKLLAEKGRFKLDQLGVPLVCEYLRNVGIDIIKPDRHIKRILASDKLNLIPYNTPKKNYNYEVIKIGENLSKELHINQAKIDYLLWNYCASGYGKICTKITPKCSQCVIKEFCNYPQGTKNNSSQIRLKNNEKIDKIQNESNLKNNDDNITSLRKKYTEYLLKKLKDKKESTIKTYVSDSFYVYKHQDEFNTNFLGILSNVQNINNFEKELLEQQISNHVEKPYNSTKAYMNGLYRLYDFINNEDK